MFQGNFNVSQIARIGILTFCLAASVPIYAQAPVFRPQVDVDQEKLLKNCPVATAPTCQYKLKTVLESGGDFYSTPFQPYNIQAKTGDGYGEGADGPRALQRQAFNPSNHNYPFLRLNGLDSQSCFECHNSIGSANQTFGEALMRKPYAVGGSAGSNSNAFINPFFPTQLTHFIRNPPHVFGTGYSQAIGNNMTDQLLLLRFNARKQAKLQSGKPVTVDLIADNIKFGQFVTTFTPGTTAVKADPNTCQAGISAPLSIGGETNFSDDLTGVQGVQCDLVIRPFQWKGIASSVRHFVRDALDFHFSMQAFEKVAFCDCDRDGKGNAATGTEVTIGQVTALVSFVTMLRPPVQDKLAGDAALGKQIFLGQRPGLYQHMCADCHVESHHLETPQVLVEWPTNPNDETAPVINPNVPSTWPISEAMCPKGNPAANACPVESSYSAEESAGALVTPVKSSQQLPVVLRFKRNIQKLQQTELTATSRKAALVQLGAPVNSGIVGQDYVIPLSIAPAQGTYLQQGRLPANPDGSVDVPIFSDLKVHDMGKFLSDVPDHPQGTDVANIVTNPRFFLTRPIWGVADTGPWLHDGRALNLHDAILMHGDSATGSGSEAAPVIDAFEKLTPQEQQAVLNFLLTLRLPTAKPPAMLASGDHK